jgi:hypothetical protein
MLCSAVVSHNIRTKYVKNIGTEVVTKVTFRIAIVG